MTVVGIVFAVLALFGIAWWVLGGREATLRWEREQVASGVAGRRRMAMFSIGCFAAVDAILLLASHI